MRGPELIEEAIRLAKECETDAPTACFEHHPSLWADRLRGLTWETIVTKAVGSYLQALPTRKAVDWLAKRDSAVEAKDLEIYLPMYREVALHYAMVRMARYPELQKLMPKSPKRQRRTPAVPPRLSQSEMDNAIRYLDPGIK
jgi:hypothetical protein